MLSPLTVSAVALAAMVTVWPQDRARARLRRDGRSRRTWRSPRLGRAAAVPCAAVVGWAIAGFGGLLAAVLATGLGARCFLAHRHRRASREQVTALAAALRVVVAELRAGAHPAAAADGAAADAPPGIAVVLRRMAATVRLGGTVTPVVREDGAAERTPLADAWARVARAWTLADQHGLALGDLLDAVRRDLDHRSAFHRDVEGRMAGPRATAGVLAALPVLGIALGEVSGAGAVHVLTHHVLGQLLLVVGVSLLCAGMLWTARITATAVMR